MQEYLNVLKEYGTFSGRARRREYWMFTLITTIIGIILAVVDMVIFPHSSVSTSPMSNVGILGGLYTLATFIPSLAVTCRRLHDTAHSGWWMLIAFVPIIGVIVLLVFTVTDSAYGPNKWGPNPKGLSTPPNAAF